MHPRSEIWLWVLLQLSKILINWADIWVLHLVSEKVIFQKLLTAFDAFHCLNSHIWPATNHGIGWAMKDAQHTSFKSGQKKDEFVCRIWRSLWTQTGLVAFHNRLQVQLSKDAAPEFRHSRCREWVISHRHQFMTLLSRSTVFFPTKSTGLELSYYLARQHNGTPDLGSFRSLCFIWMDQGDLQPMNLPLLLNLILKSIFIINVGWLINTKAFQLYELNCLEVLLH